MHVSPDSNCQKRPSPCCWHHGGCVGGRLLLLAVHTAAGAGQTLGISFFGISDAPPLSCTRLLELCLSGILLLQSSNQPGSFGAVLRAQQIPTRDCPPLQARLSSFAPCFFSLRCTSSWHPELCLTVLGHHDTVQRCIQDSPALSLAKKPLQRSRLLISSSRTLAGWASARAESKRSFLRLFLSTPWQSSRSLTSPLRPLAAWFSGNPGFAPLTPTPPTDSSSCTWLSKPCGVLLSPEKGLRPAALAGHNPSCAAGTTPTWRPPPAQSGGRSPSRSLRYGSSPARRPSEDSASQRCPRGRAEEGGAAAGRCLAPGGWGGDEGRRAPRCAPRLRGRLPAGPAPPSAASGRAPSGSSQR